MATIAIQLRATRFRVALFVSMRGNRKPSQQMFHRLIDLRVLEGVQVYLSR